MKGSFTIEASILVLLLFGIYLLVMKGGLELYVEIKDSKTCEKVEKVWEVDDFYRYSQIDKLLKQGGEVNEK